MSDSKQPMPAAPFMVPVTVNIPDAVFAALIDAIRAEDRLYTPRQVADLAQVSIKLIRNHIADGKLRLAPNFGERLGRIRRSEYLRWLDAHDLREMPTVTREKPTPLAEAG